MAATRWRGFHHELPEDAVAGAFSQPGQSTEDLDPRPSGRHVDDGSETAYSPSLPRRPTPNADPRLTAVCSRASTALPRSWIRSSKSAGIA